MDPPENAQGCAQHACCVIPCLLARPAAAAGVGAAAGGGPRFGSLECEQREVMPALIPGRRVSVSICAFVLEKQARLKAKASDLPGGVQPKSLLSNVLAFLVRAAFGGGALDFFFFIRFFFLFLPGGAMRDALEEVLSTGDAAVAAVRSSTDALHAMHKRSTLED